MTVKGRMIAIFSLACVFVSCSSAPLLAAESRVDELPQVTGVERQPLCAATERLIEAMSFAGLRSLMKPLRRFARRCRLTLIVPLRGTSRRCWTRSVLRL